MGAYAFLLWELDSDRGTRHLSRFLGQGPLVWGIYRGLNEGWLP